MSTRSALDSRVDSLERMMSDERNRREKLQSTLGGERAARMRLESSLRETSVRAEAASKKVEAYNEIVKGLMQVWHTATNFA